MTENPYDKATRFAAKLDAPGFLSWALGLPPDRLGFAGWLDTRSLPFPGEPDRTGDCVARLDPPGGTEPPWAVAIEFQAEPDPLMFARLLSYLAEVWRQFRPDAERGSRFHVGAAVLNLTGTGTASREMRLAGTPIVTHLVVVERNLASERAEDALRRIEAGEWSRCVLPWVPLMAGAEEGIITDGWKRLAEAEPSSRRRSEYGGLALVLADLAGRKSEWQNALRGWNVKESTVVNEWMTEARAIGLELGRAEGRELGKNEGRAEGQHSALLAILEEKFGPSPEDLAAAIRATTDLAQLRQWIGFAVRAESVAAFRTAAGV